MNGNDEFVVLRYFLIDICLINRTSKKKSPYKINAFKHDEVLQNNFEGHLNKRADKCKCNNTIFFGWTVDNNNIRKTFIYSKQNKLLLHFGLEENIFANLMEKHYYKIANSVQTTNEDIITPLINICKVILTIHLREIHNRLEKWLVNERWGILDTLKEFFIKIIEKLTNWFMNFLT